MGCDIHLHTEIKIKGQWHTYGSPNVERWYALFTKMAGVRNAEGIEPISAPKGFPKDAATITKFNYEKWKGSSHSASWLDSKEIAELEMWVERQFKERQGHWYAEKLWGYLMGSGWGSFALYVSDRPEGVEDVRFVFWFDN
jgi:hypothetical protein